MSSPNERPRFESIEHKPDDVDVRDLIQRSDRRARRIFEEHVERPLFPYSGHRDGRDRAFTSTPGVIPKQPRNRPLRSV